jgi:hypothetical protein
VRSSCSGAGAFAGGGARGGGRGAGGGGGRGGRGVGFDARRLLLFVRVCSWVFPRHGRVCGGVGERERRAAQYAGVFVCCVGGEGVWVLEEGREERRRRRRTSYFGARLASRRPKHHNAIRSSARDDSTT